MMRAVPACVLALGLLACAGNKLILMNGGSGQSYTLQAGQTLQLELRSNPSTGYSWQLLPGGEVLRQDGAMVFVPEPHDASSVGFGGTEVWRFSAVKPGRQTLRFEYRRPWEKDAPAAQALNYDVTVP